jgi:bidirectional [NiFe] hydrogenase diaphorase subunit
MDCAMTETRRGTAPAAELHPSGDQRFQIIDTSMSRHHHRPDALIEALHAAQELFGHLDHDILLYVARGLKLPPSRVYGVATFYHLFTFKPKGKHHCTVCLGTACYVNGGAGLLAAIEAATGIHAGQTRADGRVSLDTARCVGACGIAPLVVFDGTVCGNQEPEMVQERVKGWLSSGPE